MKEVLKIDQNQNILIYFFDTDGERIELKGEIDLEYFLNQFNSEKFASVYVEVSNELAETEEEKNLKKEE